jgi:hypothetical protein
MIREHDKYSQVGIPRSVVSTASLAKGLMTIVHSRGQGPAHIEVEEVDHLYAPWIGPKYSTIDEAREAICGYIDNIVLGRGNLESCKCTSSTFRTCSPPSSQTPVTLVYSRIRECTMLIAVNARCTRYGLLR